MLGLLATPPPPKKKWLAPLQIKCTFLYKFGLQDWSKSQLVRNLQPLLVSCLSTIVLCTVHVFLAFFHEKKMNVAKLTDSTRSRAAKVHSASKLWVTKTNLMYFFLNQTNLFQKFGFICKIINNNVQKHWLCKRKNLFWILYRNKFVGLYLLIGTPPWVET